VSDVEQKQQIAREAWSIVAITAGLVDRAEIARRYGLSRGRVHQLTSQRHFPHPVHGDGTSHPLVAGHRRRPLPEPSRRRSGDRPALQLTTPLRSALATVAP
jgi:hypothetical protein